MRIREVTCAEQGSDAKRESRPSSSFRPARWIAWIMDCADPPSSAVREMARFALDYRQCRKIHFAKCVPFFRFPAVPMPGARADRSSRVLLGRDGARRVRSISGIAWRWGVLRVLRADLLASVPSARFTVTSHLPVAGFCFADATVDESQMSSSIVCA